MVGTVALLHPVSVLKTVSGCFEAPLQMVYNIWLIIFGIIDSSFGFSCRNYQDLNGNSVCIPVSVTLSIGFSLMSILSEVLFLNLIYGKKQWFPNYIILHFNHKRDSNTFKIWPILKVLSSTLLAAVVKN